MAEMQALDFKGKKKQIQSLGLVASIKRKENGPLFRNASGLKS